MSSLRPAKVRVLAPAFAYQPFLSAECRPLNDSTGAKEKKTAQVAKHTPLCRSRNSFWAICCSSGPPSRWSPARRSQSQPALFWIPSSRSRNLSLVRSCLCRGLAETTLPAQTAPISCSIQVRIDTSACNQAGTAMLKSQNMYMLKRSRQLRQKYLNETFGFLLLLSLKFRNAPSFLES